MPKFDLNETNALVFIVYVPSMEHALEKFWQILSDQEKIKAEKFVNVKFMNNYIISHGVLRKILSYYVNIDPKCIDYSFNMFGKPFLNNGNSRVQFNISHSKDYAVYALNLDDQVGIDIEWKDENIRLHDIIEFVLCPSELIFFKRLNAEEKVYFFYEIWTKKEAIIKLIGKGLSYPMKKIEILEALKENDNYYQNVKLDNNDILYCVNLPNLDNYAWSIALTHKRKLIRIMPKIII